MTKYSVASIGLLCASFCAFAQSPSFPKLEVASIKEILRGATLFNECGTGALKVSGNRVVVSRVTVCALIKIAYSLRDFELIGAPKWATKEGSPTGYEIQAIAEGSDVLTRERASALLQVLLTDRFQLKFHKEKREISVYALVVDRDGPKFTGGTPSKCVGAKDVTSSVFRMRFSTNPFLEERPGLVSYCQPTSMDNLAQMLSSQLDRPVINRTELTAGYVFELKWDDRSSLFTALQQHLGLQLVARNERLEVMVVDRIERPSTN